MSLAKQLSAAGLCVGLVAGGLWFLGRGEKEVDPAPAAGPTTPDGADQAPQALVPSDEPAPTPVRHRTRNLVPPDAWLVVDFQGDITGTNPFSDSEGFCAKVPPPERVVLAVLPPQGQNKEGPELLLAADGVADPFWGCVRDRVVAAGGTALAQNEQFEVLKSPTGVVARGPTGSLLYLSGEAHLEPALAVLSELTPGAASQGRHLELFRRIHPDVTEAPQTLLDLTLALPEGWLDSVGREAEESPLRFLRAAYLSVALDGSAWGGVECEEPGCDQMLAFLNRAKLDLLADTPPAIRSAVMNSLTLEHVAGSGKVTVVWTPSGTGLSALIGRMLGASPFSLPGAPAR